MKPYQFKEEINYSQYFMFDKTLIRNGNWAMLTQRAKSIFPVIACHLDKRGQAFPGENTIASLAGLSEKTVRRAIDDLTEFPGFSYKCYTTNRGYRSKRFHIEIAPYESGRFFKFHKSILESGIWHMLSPTAQALFPILRTHGFWNMEVIECAGDESDFSPTDFMEYYNMREYDYCIAAPSILINEAGISSRSFGSALQDLNRNCLLDFVEEDGFVGWKLYFHSRDDTIYERSYLNERLRKSFYHHLRKDAKKLPVAG